MTVILDDGNDRQGVFAYFVAGMLSKNARVRQIHDEKFHCEIKGRLWMRR